MTANTCSCVAWLFVTVHDMASHYHKGKGVCTFETNSVADDIRTGDCFVRLHIVLPLSPS